MNQLNLFEKIMATIAILLIIFLGILILNALFMNSASAEEAYHVTEEFISLGTFDVETILEDYPEWDSELVKSIQRALNKNGADLTVDGKFGPNTGMAVKAFQRKKGLTIDGIVGPKTLKSLGLEDTGEHPRYAPNLMEAFAKSTCGKMVHLNLNSHLVEVYEQREDGGIHLIRIMLAATGNQKQGNYTNLCVKVLSRTPEKGARIADDDWRGNYAVPITAGDYFHTVLQHRKKGQWVYDDNSCLGKNVSHGCVRLAVEDAEWLQEFCQKGTVIVVDDRAWDLR